jgi:uncharacterized repeat protein (TIGR01451 family)
MKHARFIVLLAGASALAIATLAGCQSWHRTAQAPEPQVQEREPTIGLAVRDGDWPNQRELDQRFVWTSQAIPTGEAGTSTIGILKGVPREARINQPFEYRMIVTNLTPLMLDDVTIQEEFERYFSYTRSTPAGQKIADDVVAWNLGTLKPHETKSVSVFGTPTAAGRAVSCATVTYSSSLCMGVPVVAPELNLVLSAPQEVLKCDDIVYTLVVTNAGTGTVSDVQLTGPLTSGLLGADGRRSLEFAGGSLAAGQSRQFTARVRADRTGTFEQKAKAIGTGDLSAESNTVRTIVRQPKLEISRTAPEVRYVDRDIAVEIMVKNIGDGIARDLVIHDAIPEGFTVVRASDNGRSADGRVNWTFASLAPGASQKVNVTYHSKRIGSVVAKATASAYCADAVTDGTAIDIRGIPALMLDGEDHPDPVEVGGTTTYTLTVTNQGSAMLTNVRLRGTMDRADLMQFVSATGSTPVGVINGTFRDREVTFPVIARLAPGATATFKVVVRAMKAGQASFRAEAVSDEITRPLVKEEITNFYE